jgi:Tol biopolymer transport system component
MRRGRRDRLASTRHSLTTRMPLGPGTHLGPYEIVSPIGAGGMGEVYKAKDTRLDRLVAIKVLPSHVSSDVALRERFEREARTVAALNHPHICTLHDVGHQDGTDFLVMEYLDGETLAQRLTKGALPLEQALTIAIQIADALDKAHRAGIIHRDLKPGNIMLAKSGAKLLDFGLAKVTPAPIAASGLSMGPTGASPVTMQGTILGTLQYMAPEQVEGREADVRSDIFAFGAIVYEMVTGKRAFEGKSAASVVAAILERQPPAMSSLQPLTPHSVDRIVATCLAKDPDDRWQTARDLLRELKWIAEAGTRTQDAAVPRSTPRGRVRFAAAMSFSIVVGAAVAGAAIWLATRPSPPRVTRLTIAPAGAASLAVTGYDRDVAISPDGTRVVYVGGNGSRLFVRALDQIEATPLEGLGVPHHPFFSPDGAWIGFFDGLSALKKVSVNGGPAVTICRIAAAPVGATWGADGTIIFALTAKPGLRRVSANGGEPEVITTPNVREGEAYDYWPEFLPDGRGVLFKVELRAGGPTGSGRIGVLDLRTGTRKILVRDGFYGRYVSTGYLIYGVSGTLRAVPFDLNRLELAGTPIPLGEPVLMTPFGGVLDFDIAQNGTLVYTPAGTRAAARTLVWVDRQGQEEPIKAPVRAYTYPRLSPDGTRLALDVRDQDNDIWIWDFARETLSRFTFDVAQDQYPVWTPDGRRLIFDSRRAGGTANLFWQAADGTGAAEQLAKSPIDQLPNTTSPDGTRVVFRADEPRTGLDLMLLTLNKERQIQPLVQTSFNELNAEISPDGRWLAYESNESGQYEIYVRPFPDAGGGRWQISNGGGTKPLWARKGQELFYVAPTGALMAVGIAPGATFSAGTPTKLFEGRYYVGDAANVGRTYDVSPDGRRFLMMKADTTTPPQIIVVQHFDEELKRLVPTK